MRLTPKMPIIPTVLMINCGSACKPRRFAVAMQTSAAQAREAKMCARAASGDAVRCARLPARAPQARAHRCAARPPHRAPARRSCKSAQARPNPPHARLARRAQRPFSRAGRSRGAVCARRARRAPARRPSPQLCVAIAWRLWRTTAKRRTRGGRQPTPGTFSNAGSENGSGQTPGKRSCKERATQPRATRR